jgi:hypothetical protein
VLPALFAEGISKPTIVKQDETIYVQVTPRGNVKGEDAVVEIHFFDLWSVECGLWAAGASAVAG